MQWVFTLCDIFLKYINVKKYVHINVYTHTVQKNLLIISYNLLEVCEFLYIYIF